MAKSNHPLILVADDHVDAVALIGQQLELEGYQHAGAYDGQETLERVEELRPDLLLLDMKMPELDGLQVIRRLRSNPEYDDLMIIVLTAERMDEADEIAGLDAGADDYLTKPINRSILVRRVRAMLRLCRLEAENRQLRLEVTRRHGLGEMVGTSKLMQDAYNLVEKVAPTDTFVLITGESGTGKELVASAIHKHSHRSSGPLVRVNLGSLSSNLVESELFGHEKGAFTGAVRDKKGKFELAEGGTIFLDEVGDIPLESQVKLLRVLQEREFDRVGGERTLKTDVRVIAATNKDLETEVEQGRFREDLYYRLDVIPIRLPALRERRDDIMALATHFLASHANELGAGGCGAHLGGEARVAGLRVARERAPARSRDDAGDDPQRAEISHNNRSPVRKAAFVGRAGRARFREERMPEGPARAHRAPLPRGGAGQQSVESDDDGAQAVPVATGTHQEDAEIRSQWSHGGDERELVHDCYNSTTRPTFHHHE